jgi:hypothetical protein
VRGAVGTEVQEWWFMGCGTLRHALQLSESEHAELLDRVANVLPESSAVTRKPGVDHKRLRFRDLKHPLPEAVADALARFDSEGMILESFGEDQQFATSKDFLDAWGQYEKDTLSLYQSRGSDRVQAVNA